MALLKPTRRDIVKAAADQTRRRLFKDADNKHKESRQVSTQAEELRSDAAERLASRQVKKLEPLAKALNAVTEKAGHGSPFVVATSYDGHSRTAGSNVIIQINCDHSKLRIKTKAKYPKDTAKITELVKKAHRLTHESSDLRKVARELDDSDVISGSINAALNGESAAALEVLVSNIKEVALDHASRKPGR